MSGLGDSINRVTEEDRLRGVRGLLLFPPVLIGFAILPWILTVVGKAWSGQLGTTEGEGAVIIAVAFVPLGVLSIWKLFQEKRSAYWLMIAFFLLYAAASLMSLSLVLQQQQAPGELIIGVFRDAVVAPATLLYLFTSRRVRLTLIN